MKFHKIIYSFLALVTAGLASCEDLKFGNEFMENPIMSDINIDVVFSKKTLAEQVLAEAYHSLPDFLPQGDRLNKNTLETLTDLGDCNMPGSLNEYYTGQMSSSSNSLYFICPLYERENNPGRSPLYGIRTAYIFIENVDRVPDMSDEEKKIRKAEAKMVIAFHYTQLFRYYGGMPWIDHAYGLEDDFTFRRLTVEQTVDRIEALIDEAAADLPWSVTAGDDGRMTAAAALALKTRLLLFAASPLFNNSTPYMSGAAADEKLVWYGGYSQERWQKAMDACVEFLEENEANGNLYKLVSTGDPRNDFANGYFNRYNFEVLISSRWRTVWTAGIIPVSQVRFGCASITLNYVNMFAMNDGTPFDWTNPDHAANPFFDATGKTRRDIRLYETCAINGDKFKGRTAETFEGGIEYRENRFAYNGFGLRKHVRDRASEMAQKFYQMPLLRMPEIYLNLAEAMNEMGKAGVKDKFNRDAYDYVNIVRGRAGMPALDRTKATPGEKLREAILLERALEFGFEEVRYFDLNRWKRSDWLQVPLQRLVIKKNGNNFTYSFDRLAFDRTYITNWSDKYYLSPFPLDEINKNYGLVQNPGW